MANLQVWSKSKIIADVCFACVGLLNLASGLYQSVSYPMRSGVICAMTQVQYNVPTFCQRTLRPVVYFHRESYTGMYKDFDVYSIQQA